MRRHASPSGVPDQRVAATARAQLCRTTTSNGGCAHADAESDRDRAHCNAMHRADEVVQDLAAAKYALTVGDSDRAMAAIDGALATARLMLATLLDLVTPPDLPTYAGALVLQALLETGDDHAPAVIPPTRRRSSA